MDTHHNITYFFEDLLRDLECQEDTKAYIISIYGKYKSSQFDYSKDSITLLFSKARNKHDFLTYRNVGDWVFISNTVFPEHLRYASPNYYRTLAQLSYYSCYKLINRQWKCFEEMADRFPLLEEQTKTLLSKSINQNLSDSYSDLFDW